MQFGEVDQSRFWRTAKAAWDRARRSFRFTPREGEGGSGASVREIAESYAEHADEISERQTEGLMRCKDLYSPEMLEHHCSAPVLNVVDGLKDTPDVAAINDKIIDDTIWKCCGCGSTVFRCADCEKLHEGTPPWDGIPKATLGVVEPLTEKVLDHFYRYGQLDLREPLAIWAEAHMERDQIATVYPSWEKTWWGATEFVAHRLRLCGNDIGADIALSVCPQGYGANPESWNGINLGNVHSIEQIDQLYHWIDDKAEAQRGIDEIKYERRTRHGDG